MKTLLDKIDFIRNSFHHLQGNGEFYCECKRAQELQYDELPESMKVIKWKKTKNIKYIVESVLNISKCNCIWSFIFSYRQIDIRMRIKC